MQSIPKIWFLRHGQTEWNKAYRLQGQLDSPLTTQGIADAQRQAEIMAPILAQSPPCFVSPLGRTMHTAKIALGTAPFTTDDRLMEIHAGDWQGRYRKDIMADRPTWSATQPSPLEIYERAEGGEGMAALKARVAAFLNDLTQPSVIVAHGLLGQVLRAQICGLSDADAGKLSNHQGCVYMLEDGTERVLDAAP